MLLCEFHTDQVTFLLVKQILVVDRFVMIHSFIWLIPLFSWKCDRDGEREKNRKKKEVSFHLFGHSLNGWNSQIWARLTAVANNSLLVSHRILRPKIFGPSFSIFVRASTRKMIECRLSRTQATTQIWNVDLATGGLTLLPFGIWSRELELAMEPRCSNVGAGESALKS